MFLQGQCYTTSDWSNPCRSTDFGDGGYTGSLTDWHELLQLTAPDPHCGVLFVRGNFPSTTDAILSRAQRRDRSGEKGTFGLEIDSKDSNFALGERRSQGLVNFKWPYIQFELKRKLRDGRMDEGYSGTYETISFIKDRILYQVVCVSLGTSHGPDEPIPKINFRIGGQVRFGCLCSTATNSDGCQFETPPNDIPRVNWDNELRPICQSDRYQKLLEMQLFINDEPKEMTRGTFSPHAHEQEHTDTVDFFAMHEVGLIRDEPTFIITTFALRESPSIEPLLTNESFHFIEDYLGVSPPSINMTDRLWTACLTTSYEAVEAVEFCIIARSVEQTLSVATIALDAGPNRDAGLALIGNIMTGQYVDLQSVLYALISPL
jgi:hypothetical protein